MRIPVPILLYHSISDQASSKFARWAVSPGLFEAHLAYLEEAGYHAYTVTEWLSVLRHGSFNSEIKPVVITFDDGFADFHSTALPLLLKYGLKATIYITTKYIGGSSLWLQQAGEADRLMMSWEQVSSLGDFGIECGSHGFTHPQLDTLPVAAAGREILHSKEILEQKLDRHISSFAYPHGYYSQSVQSMVQKAGYSSACAVKHALSSTEDDHFALARLIIASDTHPGAFQLMLEGKNMRVAPFPERLQTKVWRRVRWLLARIHAAEYRRDHMPIANSSR